MGGHHSILDRQVRRDRRGTRQPGEVLARSSWIREIRGREQREERFQLGIPGDLLGLASNYSVLE